MAFFTDAAIASLSDLKDYESSILDLAGAEGIDLGAKLGLAKRELSLELTGFLLKRGVLTGTTRELNHVVVTEPLLHTYIMQTLALVYRDAFNSQLNDRYEGKWKQYVELARNAMRQLLDIGVGIASSPIPRATQPVLSIIPGGLLGAMTYCVRIAAIGLSGFTGDLSDSTFIAAVPGSRLRIELPESPVGTTGWVVYAGPSEDEVYRQNEVPVNGTDIWLAPESGIRYDLPGLRVQGPDYYVTARQDFFRG